MLEPLDHIECRDALLEFVPLSVEEDRGEGSPASDPFANKDAQAGQSPAAHTLRFLKSPPDSAPPALARDGGSVNADAEAVRGKSFVKYAAGAVEAVWPKASVVIGNPPFLGGSKKRRELGDAYFQALAEVFKGRVPGGADLVCYWFDKARIAIQTKGLGAAGLVATQSIRNGSNRTVLEAIGRESRIFDAWSDEAWVNEGAAVRVSLVCFGGCDDRFLNGKSVLQITTELGGSVDSDMSLAKPLVENFKTSFEGTKKYGDFDVPGELARSWLRQPNPHGRPNSEVVRPWRNGQGLAKRPTDTWIVDFGSELSESEAGLFEAPFKHVLQMVRPERLKAKLPENWWLHERSRGAMRVGLRPLSRYLATVRVSKHRYFCFLDSTILPDTRLNVFARADDASFGILTSRVHEVWSLSQASIHGDGNEGGRPTYNAKSCFETFPFPEGLTPADTAHQQTEPLSKSSNLNPRPEEQGVKDAVTALIPARLPTTVRPHAEAIARAAKRLNDLREAWLNSPEWTERVPEVIPLGMMASPYPDRILPNMALKKTWPSAP